MSCLLALDCSTERMALALSSPAGLWLHEGEGGAQASARLLPELQRLLQQAGLTLAQLDALAFGRGPGAFTGCVPPCAVAQGLAFGAGKPVLALDSLMLVAEDARRQAGAAELASIWVAMDARMGELYAGAYCHDGRHWRCSAEPALYTPAALLARWAGEPPMALCGSGLALLPPPQPSLPCWPETRSRAAALAALAAAAWAQGLTLPAEQACRFMCATKWR